MARVRYIYFEAWASERCLLTLFLLGFVLYNITMIPA